MDMNAVNNQVYTGGGGAAGGLAGIVPKGAADKMFDAFNAFADAAKAARAAGWIVSLSLESGELHVEARKTIPTLPAS